MTTTPATEPNVAGSGRTRRASWGVLVAVWAFPVLVLGQFAFVAGIPVVLVVVGTLRDRRLRAAGWWTGVLAAAYLVPLSLWLLGPSDAPSLSKFLSPVGTAIVVAAGVAGAVGHHVARRRSARAQAD
ncbi:hypothetical protein GCM10022222_66950 [Amycolatopsis ultiminotia]|uniref:SPW repeat-containing protein n=2 Tax=Amycolatopsis ultiminotia TaxID=543629 RepID=A0ABP6XVF7_9PSEU